ncbi:MULTISPECIES: DUF4810 domain-containing protein [unclassified Acidovorax]|uniref:DUF4810 domain-containing protein n=1 Tax=unclassified Acidovorax TaxID=2684926 RepID=UPI00288339BC|nr:MULTISPECIES: DUF4810 domain-containing protein [unclassified Acidovorax]
MTRATVRGKAALAAATLALLAGCVTPQKQLYSWEGYQPQVYAYLKDNGVAGPEEQIVALEAAAEKARANGTALPPGYHAHLAMLYSKTGQIDKTALHFAAEKEQFPESSTFMDFLMKTSATKGGN